MANFLQDSAVGDVTRGGQLVIHFLRMIGQVLRKFGAAMLVTILLAAVGVFLSQTTSYERYLAWRWGTTWISVQVFPHSDSRTSIDRADGSSIDTTMAALYRSPALRSAAFSVYHRAIRCAVYSLFGVGFVFLLLFRWVWRAGTHQRQETHLRGSEIVEAADLSRELRQSGRASPLKFAGVPLLLDSETSHVLLAGAPGTGKSSSLYHYLRTLRERGHRVICYSPSGDMIQWFYREGRDVILNPFDARCPQWDLWHECPENYHFDMLAAALVPEARAGDPFWNTSARSVISSLLQATRDRGHQSVRTLLELLTQVDLATLQQYLAATEAAALIDPKNEKTSFSIRTTAATYARALRHLPTEVDELFHIREWVHEDRGDAWVFLNATPEQLESARPLLSAFLEVFTNALLSLPPSRTRRIALVIDELPDLHKLPSLPLFLAQARKYGGCGVVSFQNIAQMRDRYGREAAAAIASLCATWVCMRQNDPETAKWVSEAFGQREIMESNQGVSYGANDMRDGVSLSQQRKLHSVLLASQVLSLDNLEGYIRLPGRVPIGHFRLAHEPVPSRAPAFIARMKIAGSSTSAAPNPHVTLAGDLFEGVSPPVVPPPPLPDDRPAAYP